MTAVERTNTDALKAAVGNLRAAIEALQRPGLLNQWRFWHGPPEAMSQEEALQGDVSGWKAVETPTGWSTASGDTWLRTTLAYPETVETIPTAGSSLELETSLLVDSEVFVDGQVVAEHDWWLDARIAPIPLTDAYETGCSFEIACHIPQGDGLGSYSGAVVRCERIANVILELELLQAQLTFSHFLVAGDEGATRAETWREAVSDLDWEALAARDWATWRESVAPVVDRLASLTPEAKAYQVHTAAHAHIDMNWLWPWEDTVDVIRRDFRAMDELMERYPDFHFSQSQASTYWAMAEHEPEILEQVQKRVRQGLWEVTANTWVENDLNMSSTEAMAHHFLYTRRYMRELFGHAPRLIWEPDTFGHPITMPQIVRKAGAEYYYFCRGGKRYPLFWWESPDGARILGFQDLHWYLGPITPTLIADSAQELAESHDLRHSLVVYGAGDHGGGATARDIETARLIDAAPCLPSVRFSSVVDFFDAVKEADPDLPVVREELNPVFAGCYTSHADIKRLNRQGENALADAEALATAASLWTDYAYPRHDLEEQWRAVLFQQFHDILCGCGIGLTSETAHAWAEPAIDRAREIGQAALKAVTADAAGEEGLAIFNTLPWRRSGPVVAQVDWDCSWVEDDQRNKVPAQRDGDTLIFVAKNVPALGYRVYRPGDAEPLPIDKQAVRSPAPLTLENGHLSLKVDPRSGAITRLQDKVADRDLTYHAHGDPGAQLDTRGVINRMQIHWEQPHSMSAWKLGDISRVDHLVSGAHVTLTEAGPVRGTIRVTREFLNSRLVQQIRLYRGSRRIDFETEVEWHEQGSDSADAPMLRTIFGPFLNETRATYQIPFGAISRVADGQEVPGQMWGDLSERDGSSTYGVALLNDCKYGYQAHGNTLSLTLLRASYEPDQNPDEGLHRFTYAFYPHPGDWQEAQVERQAQELNRPLWVQPTASTEGDLASKLDANVPTLRYTGEGVALTGIKRAEEGQGVIIRLVEMQGTDNQAVLHLPRAIRSAQEVSLAEEPLEAGQGRLEAADKMLQILLGPYEIRTIQITF